MNFTGKNVKIILGIITFTVVLFAASQHLSVVAAVISEILGILAPVTVGLCLAFILNIPMSLLERKVFAFTQRSKHKAVQKLSRPASLIVTVLLAIGFIAVLLLIIIPQLNDTVVMLVNKIPVYYDTFVGWVDRTIVRLDLEIDTNFLHNPRFDFEKISQMSQKIINKENANTILNTTVGVTSSVVSGVVNFALGSVIAVYVLAEKEKIGKFFNRLIKRVASEKVYEKFRKIISVAADSFSSFISGQFTDALLLGFLCFIGMALLRLPYAAVVSVVIGVFALLPVIGPIIGEAIGCFIIFMVSPFKALVFLIFILLLQAVDNNFIYPRIVGKSVGLPGILVLIAVIIGGNIGGILGVILGVPIASASYAIIVSWLDNERKNEPINNDDAVFDEISSPETEQSGIDNK